MKTLLSILALVAMLVGCGSRTPTAQFAVLCDGPERTYVVTVPRPPSGGYAGAARQAAIKVWGRVWKAFPEVAISDVWFYCAELDNNEKTGSAGYLPVDPRDWRVTALAEVNGVKFAGWGKQTAARRICLSDTGPQVGPWIALSLPDGWEVP